jgi:cell division septation protein DedD
MGDSKEISDETMAAPLASAPPRNRRHTDLLPLGLAFVALVILNAGLYLRLAAPTQPPAVVADAVQAPAAAIPATAAVSAAAVVVADGGNLLLADTFAVGQGDTAWRAYGGEWVTENNAMRQVLPDGFDHGILREGLFLNYSYAVTVQQLEGVGAGVLFNVPNIAAKNGGHLVRFSDDGSGIFWGQFDEQGTFTGQGYVATTAPGAAPHRLEVFSGDTTYAIKLDGAVIAQDIPLLSKSGHIGLLASQTVAAFSDIQLHAITGDAGEFLRTDTGIAASAVVTASRPVNELLGENGVAFATISGDWVQNGEIIAQNYLTATDFLVGTGVMAERYLLNATIQMTYSQAITDAGAGIVFHMPARDNKAGAQMVRFVEAGKGLAWGHFDEAGAFIGEGYSELNLSPDEAHKLTLAAQGDTYDIFVNNKPVVQNLRAQNTGGFIGLASYRGPNQFRTVELRIGSVAP